MNPKRIVLVLIGIYFLWVGAVSVSAQELVQAKVALEIKGEGNAAWAGSHDRITSRDKLRIYVIPKTDLQVYVVYTNFEKAVLMMNKRIPGDKVLSLPEKGHYFQADGSTKQEGFTIVCSRESLMVLDDLFKEGKTTYQKWKKVEKQLSAQGKVQIGQSLEKPVPMAGAVRSIPKSGDHEGQIRKDLLTYSGKSVLVRRYVFDVQK